KNEIARHAGKIARSEFLFSNNPRPALDNDSPAAETRHLRSHSELERMKTERDHPAARKRSKILTRSNPPQANVPARLIDIDFRLGGRNRAPVRSATLGCNEIAQFWQRIGQTHRGGGGEIGGIKPETKIRFSENSAGQRV